jgi:hypothetical protein
MASDITQKVLIDIETKKARKELENLAKMSNSTDEAMLRMAGRAEELEKALNDIKSATPIGAFASFKSGMKSIGDAMTPLNQGLELVNKGVKFLGDGLDAASKRYPSYRKDIDALKASFSDLKENVMAAVGVMTVELARPIPVLNMLKTQVEGLDASFAQSAFLGGFAKGKASGQFFRGDDESADPLSNLSSAFRGFQQSLKGGVDYWNTSGNAFVDSFTEGMKKSAAAAKAAAVEAARWKAEWDQARLAEMGSNGRARYFDTIASGNSPVDSGFKINTGLMDQGRDIGVALDKFNAGSGADRYKDWQQSFSGRQGNKTMLESMFGPVDEINAYATAFNTLTTATQSAMQAWISGSESLGAAIKKGLAAALGGLATSLAVESLKHGAYALGSLAFGDIRGAGQHGAAAAAFGAGAVAAAAAAKQLGGSGGSTPAGGGRDQRGGGEGGEGGRGNGGAVNSNRTREAGGVERIYIIDDQFSDLTPRQRMLAIEKKMRDQGRRTHGDDD